MTHSYQYIGKFTDLHILTCFLTYLHRNREREQKQHITKIGAELSKKKVSANSN